MSTTSSTTLSERIAAVVETVSGGTIPAEKAVAPSVDLGDHGLTSLGFLQLIDAVENEFGVYVDLEGGTEFLRTVEGIAGYVAAQGGA